MRKQRSLKPGVGGASSSGGHQAESTQEDIERMSDHLYTFHVPESATLDILLFHGLECERAHVPDAHPWRSTWRSTAETEEKEEIWPQKWLPEDFPHARIISVCYDGSSKKTDREGGMDLFLIGENLVQDILLAREHCSDRPVILVGHGFGGVVLKKLCVHAQEKKEKPVNGKDMDTFLESIRGFFFYSTPHKGVEGIEPPIANEGPLLRWMRVLNAESARLHEAFCEMWMARRYNWTIYGLGEVQSTLGQHGLRVPEGSTGFGDVYITVQEHHYSVCRPSGKHDNRYQYLHNLIERVQRQLERKPPLMVPEVTVGVDGLLTEILGKRIRDHKFLGFFGMGGVGKTTLAKLIFNKIFAKFDFSCFVEEIKQIPGTKDEVKKKVWEKMLRHGVPVRSASGSSGAGEWYQVTGRSLLVVFDDVQDTDHVKLLKEIAHDNGMEESRFIVTGRDRNRLRDCAQDIHICGLDVLEDVDANKLFITYAFPGQQEPPESLRPVVKQVVDGCEGLPLTLEVLGMYLRGEKETEQWEEIPTALRECNKIADLDQKVWAKLQLSYDRLPENEVKYMFLDIASFFIFSEVSDRFPVDSAISAWTSMYGIGHSRLQTLVDRAMVRIITTGKDDEGNDEREFYLHEHLRKMGQRIAKMEGRSFDLSRVRTLCTSDSDSDSDPGENAHNQYPPDDHVIFQGDQELGKIVAHRVSITKKSMLVCGQTCAFCIMREVWPKLTAIRYLILNVEVSDCCQECKNRGCPLPNTLVLFHLEFENKGDFVISGGTGTNFPDDTTGTLVLTGCTSLVSMVLQECNNVDLGGLNKLQYLQSLVIEVCGGIRKWPTSLRGLTNLKRLCLLHIEKPFELPITLGNLTNLELLVIGDCEVTSVPSSLQNLTSLRTLVVEGVIGTEAIPNVIGFLRRLEILELECCGIVNLLDGLRELTALRELSLTCEGITELPDTLGNLTNLEELSLTCPISCLPASVSNLMRLEMLWLDGRFGTVQNSEGSVFVSLKEDEILCPIDPLFHHLQGFMTKQKGLTLKCQHGMSAIIVRNMISLESLKLFVTGPQAVPDIFGDLRKLRIFKLKCEAMESSLVESLARLSSLEELDLVCRTVEQLPDIFGCFSTLKTLRIECPALQALPDTLGNFIDLTTVRISGSGLRELPGSFAQLSQLREFHLTGCNTLTTLPDFGGCSSSLVSLCLGAWEISRDQPQTMWQLQGLKELQISGQYLSEQFSDSFKSHSGDHLQHLPETIWQMSHLESLALCDLPKLTTLPEALENLHSLQKLKLQGCAIQSLPESLGRLSGLTRLEIRSCDNLKTLPNTIGGLSSLGFLVLEDMHNLTTLSEALGNLHSLRKLVIRRCAIESLPENLGGLSSLTSLELVGSSALDSIPKSLGKLSCLTVLDLSDCTSLKTLPETIGDLSSLRELVLSGSGLHSLPKHLRKMGQRIPKMEGRSFHLSRVRTLSTSTSNLGAEVHNRYPYDDQVVFQELEDESEREFSSKQSWAGSSSSEHSRTLRADAVALGFTGFEDPFDPGRLLVIHIESSEADLDAFEELVFLHDEGMALLFGVALPFSKVVLRSNGEIAVYEVGETKWRQLWIWTDSQIGSVQVFDARATTEGVFQGTDSDHAGEIRGYVSDSEQAFKCHPLQRSLSPFTSIFGAIRLSGRGSGGTTTDALLTEMNNSRGFTKAGGSSSVVATEVRREQQPGREVTIEIYLDPDTCEFEDSIIPDQLLDQLSDHRIEPVLVLTFFKEPKGDQTLRRFRSALDFRFYMKGKRKMLASDHEKFGWYHNDLELSFTCSGRGVRVEGVNGSCRTMIAGHDNTPGQNMEEGNASSAGGNEHKKVMPEFGSQKLVSTNNSGDATNDTGTGFYVKLQGSPAGIGCLAYIADNYNIWDTEERQKAFSSSGMMSDALFKLDGNWTIRSEGFTHYELIGRRDFILKTKRTNFPRSVRLSGLDHQSGSSTAQDSESRVSQKIHKRFQVDHSFTSFEDLRDWQFWDIEEHAVAPHPISGMVDVVPESSPGNRVSEGAIVHSQTVPQSGEQTLNASDENQDGNEVVRISEITTTLRVRKFSSSQIWHSIFHIR
ncbi:hypothetical protein R1sor_022203 [Riccia sorocarpa]|uniref:NB-ARC domain-containing protein n=1 Tax=Riccia sorocarpa TaxID=122646 RepID=A0ABD3GJ63_9MARC